MKASKFAYSGRRSSPFEAYSTGGNLRRLLYDGTCDPWRFFEADASFSYSSVIALRMS
jgi:hypothetical protein